MVILAKVPCIEVHRSSIAEWWWYIENAKAGSVESMALKRETKLEIVESESLHALHIVMMSYAFIYKWYKEGRMEVFHFVMNFLSLFFFFFASIVSCAHIIRTCRFPSEEILN